MTNERMLKRLLALTDSLNDNEQTLIDIAIECNNKFTECDSIVSMLANLILDVKADMEMEFAKKNGAGEKLKCAKNILKRGEIRPVLKYAYTDESGIQTLCDGYCLVRLKEPLDLPELPSNETYINYKAIMPKQIKPTTLNLPSISELKTYYKLKKAEKLEVICWEFGEGLPLVDAEFLIDVMTLVPNAVARWEKYSIEFTNDNGDYGLLMVIRKEWAK